ncbi:cytochrome P450 3A24-like [Ixodes scapularis]|uniref:cytochrome P450 3A24-like n=1 Tax=Ixodes scapularis TaxID=6945 RepID=UPI001C38CFE3|nr:cytochrome P450 3A24-like [Ixodes scapularis]
MGLLGFVGLPDWIFLLATALVLLYMYITRNSNYWKKQNVVHMTFFETFGMLLKILRMPIHELDLRNQRKYGKLFGAFEGSSPTLIVSDPEIVKQVLVKDFSHLANRRLLTFNDDILNNMMSLATVERWRRIRPAVSPAFSTGKLRKMNGLIQDCAKLTCEHLHKAAENNEELDIKQFFGHYTLDVIGRCAFGTKVDSHSNQTNEFVTKARKAFTTTINPLLLVIIVLSNLFPSLFKVLSPKFFPTEIFVYFKDICVSIIEKRKEANIKHQDFLQLMVDAQESGIAEVGSDGVQDMENSLYNLGSEQKSETSFITKSLTQDEALSQCVLFFTAGFETTSTTIAFAVYQLALCPDIQDRLRQEVDDCFAKHGPEPSLDAVSKLEYLHCVVSETLRMYPPAPRVDRTTTTEYVLEGTGIRLFKGCVVGIPVYAMHHDPQNFPDPFKFDPERFSNENMGSIRPYTYLPFGAGPRNCVGMRFAIQMVKLCLAHAVHNVRFVRTAKTQVPMVFQRGIGLLNAEDWTIGIRQR